MTQNPIPVYYRSRIFVFCLAVLSVALTQLGCGKADSKERAPNVIIVFLDDVGYEDVGVYGARNTRTPNIDNLALEGVRFTSFYVPTSSCSPSRAALLTGRYPNTVGIPNVLGPRSRIGLDTGTTTLAEFFRAAGYTTAAVGKWHLGDHPEFLPTSHGFDSYFGLPYSNDMSPVVANNPRERARNHPEIPLIRDTLVVAREPDQKLLTRSYTQEALSFINQNAKRPFFLYYAHTYAHVPLWVPEEVEGTSQNGIYGDVIEQVDESVGAILEHLENLKIKENTIVVFTSDNGPWLVFGDHAGSAGPFREGKASSFEGGHRVPGIISWPGRIDGGRVSDEIASVLDIFPTLASALSVSIPDTLTLHGRDLWPLLNDSLSALTEAQPFFYYRAGDLQAVRLGKWKFHTEHSYPTLDGGRVGEGGQLGVYARADLPASLFDLENDPGETTNLIDQYPAVADEMMLLIQEGRRRFGDRALGIEGSESMGPGRVEIPWSVQTR